MIDGAVAWVTCGLRELHDGGDHEIAIGEVLAVGGRRRNAAASSSAAPTDRSARRARLAGPREYARRSVSVTRLSQEDFG